MGRSDRLRTGSHRFHRDVLGHILGWMCIGLDRQFAVFPLQSPSLVRFCTRLASPPGLLPEGDLLTQAN
jgi:hypothetical protein